MQAKAYPELYKSKTERQLADWFCKELSKAYPVIDIFIDGDTPNRMKHSKFDAWIIFDSCSVQIEFKKYDRDSVQNAAVLLEPHQYAHAIKMMKQKTVRYYVIAFCPTGLTVWRDPGTPLSILPVLNISRNTFFNIGHILEMGLLSC